MQSLEDAKSLFAALRNAIENSLSIVERSSLGVLSSVLDTEWAELQDLKSPQLKTGYQTQNCSSHGEKILWNSLPQRTNALAALAYA